MIQEVLSRITFHSIEIINENSLSVSYTHLDVYKRQVLYSVHLGVSGCGCVNNSTAYLYLLPMLLTSNEYFTELASALTRNTFNDFNNGFDLYRKFPFSVSKEICQMKMKM